jgi:hypothetical protein
MEKSKPRESPVAFSCHASGVSRQQVVYSQPTTTMKSKLTTLTILSLLLAACSDKTDHAAQVSGGDDVLLTTKLPPEGCCGTPPKPITKVPNLMPRPTKAPEILVPADTVLLSKGRKVTGSDDNPIIGTLDLITDGDKDAGEGYFVELMDGLQWVQIDLEKSAAIHAIWLWHFHSQWRAYHDVIVQIADDPEFKTGVTTVFNNDYDNTAKLGKATDNPYIDTRFGRIVDGKGTQGRYVRLYSNGNTANEMNHYIEVEVFGSPG